MFDTMTTADLTTELRTAAQHLAVGTCRFLLLTAEFDDREGWTGQQVKSCADWLHRHTGLSLRTARDHLRVAHALRRLPVITSAFAEGRVSYSKVRALVRMAHAAEEDVLLALAMRSTTAELEARAREVRSGAEPRSPDARRELRWRRAADGSLLVHARIPAGRGEAFLGRIERFLALTEDEVIVGAASGQSDVVAAEVRRRVPDAPMPAPIAAATASTTGPRAGTTRRAGLPAAEEPACGTGEHRPLAARRLDAMLALVGVGAPPDPGRFRDGHARAAETEAEQSVAVPPSRPDDRRARSSTRRRRRHGATLRRLRPYRGRRLRRPAIHRSRRSGRRRRGRSGPEGRSGRHR
jgi:hypothetical protein